MDQEDTEAALLALAGALVWRHHQAETWEEYCTEREAADGKRYNFSLTRAHGSRPRCDAERTLLPWLLSVERCASTRNQWQVDVSVCDNWIFPCQSVTDGKAICERVVQADDCLAVERLDRSWYSLEWEAYRRGREQGTRAFVRREYGFVAEYRVSCKKWWFLCYFTALYKVRKSEERERLGLRPASRSLRWYKTEARAQAACEQYHRTGSWK